MNASAWISTSPANFSAFHFTEKGARVSSTVKPSGKMKRTRVASGALAETSTRPSPVEAAWIEKGSWLAGTGVLHAMKKHESMRRASKILSPAR